MIDLHTHFHMIAPVSKTVLAWSVIVALAATSFGQEPKMPDVIQRIDVVHMTHTDIGFTDHPLVCRRQQMRYLDIAIDAVLATSDAPLEARFCWTAETTLAVGDWWHDADAAPNGARIRDCYPLVTGTAIACPCRDADGTRTRQWITSLAGGDIGREHFARRRATHAVIWEGSPVRTTPISTPKTTRSNAGHGTALAPTPGCRTAQEGRSAMFCMPNVAHH